MVKTVSKCTFVTYNLEHLILDWTHQREKWHQILSLKSNIHSPNGIHLEATIVWTIVLI